MVIPIRKISATEAIVESLKDRILQGEFGPGDRLPSEQVFIREYKVSRLTLREALARLSALGIIKVCHGKGAFVKSRISIHALDNVLLPLFPTRDPDRLKDLEEARKLIESEIAAKAAEKRTDKQIAYLSSLFKLDLKTCNSPEKYAERDFLFHFTLAEVANNQFFLVMYQALHNQISDYLVQYARVIEDRQAAMNKHRPILEAIVEQDADKARRLALAHASNCSAFLEEMIKANHNKTKKGGA